MQDPLAWLDDIDYMDPSWETIPHNAPHPSDVHSRSPAVLENTLNYTSLVRDYFLRKARVSSLALDKPDCMWYSRPPMSTVQDTCVTNIFLHLFRRHITATFSLFRDTDLSGQAHTPYIMAMAAVGGLFCSVAGSYNVARALYNDSRRMLLAKVRASSARCCC